jgi:hypothetical protein
MIGVLTLAGLLIMKNRNRLARIKILASDWEKDDGWMVVPLVVMATGLVMILATTLTSPLTEWDAFAIWGSRQRC